MSNDYYQRQEISNSMLTQLAQDPFLFYERYVADPPKKQEESEDFLIGSATHCLELELEKFCERYIVKPEVDRRTNEGKQTYAKFLEMCEGRKVLTTKQHDLAFAMFEKLELHADLQSLLEHDHFVEREIYFDLEGHKCRSKIDVVIPSLRTVIDLKTTRSINPKKFAWSVADYGYHRQAAFYLAAAKAEFGGHSWRMIFACVEKSYPHHTALYELDDRAIMQGYYQIGQLLAELEMRKRNNDWLPQVSRGIVPLTVPKVALFDYEGEDQ